MSTGFEGSWQNFRSLTAVNATNIYLLWPLSMFDQYTHRQVNWWRKDIGIYVRHAGLCLSSSGSSEELMLDSWKKMNPVHQKINLFLIGVY